MKKFLLILLFLITGTASQIFAQGYSNLIDKLTPPLFGASPFQDSLWGFDTTNFQVIYRCGPTPSSGGSITGINGLTIHPCTGEIYVICKQSATTGRTLGKFNPATAVVTIIGNLGDNFSSITFREDGQMYGVTGDGATTPEALYFIDITTATPTFIRFFGNGADGEVISYNKDDNMIYHWSGNGTVVFEKTDINGVTVTGVPIIGTTNGETFGATYLGSNIFLISNIGSRFQKINANGTWGPQYGNTSPDDIRGLGIVNRWIVQNGSDTICANDSSMLAAMGGQAYQWTLNNVPIAGATSSTYYANQTGWYNCLITTDTANCTGTAADTAWFSKKLHVNPLPIVNITPNPITYLCNAGDSVLLTGSGGGTSQWYYNGGIIIGANTNTYSTNAPGVYNMIKTNMNGCSDSAAVGTTVMMAPAITLSPGADLCYGDSIALTTTVGASIYNWLESGTLFTTTSTETLYATTSGSYSVSPVFGSCIDTSSTSIVNIAPEYNITPNGGATICLGSNVLLTATPGGSSYQWLDDGAVIAGATTDTHTVASSGNFSVIITFPGCTDTSVTSFNLTVIDCSGIEENSTSSVIVYPNPAIDFIRIKSDQEIQQVQITDMVGKIIQQKNINGVDPVININDLAPGVYLITIDTEKGTQSGRFVKE